MTADKLKALAWVGKEPPYLKTYEALYFVRMLRIYELYRKGMIAESAAVADTNKALNEFTNNQRLFEAEAKRAMYSAQFYKNIELATSAYRKERTIEKADRLLSVIDGLT